MTKPPYRVPPMTEIRQTEPNGLRVVTTFGGAGGSTTGYRLAGYQVIACVEFTPAAVETYESNHDTPVLAKDIRDVTGGDIRAAAGWDGEIDLLDGSPPCDPFSTSGPRDKGWGKTKQYLGHAEQRTDDLFPEFARILAELRPRGFVTENVAGLVAGRARGYFLELLPMFRACGYQIEAKVLDASWLGVPQARKRLFLIGVRDDLGTGPAWPQPLPYRYTLRDALDAAVELPGDPAPTPLSAAYVQDWRRQHKTAAVRHVYNLYRSDMHKPAHTVVGLGGVRAGAVHPYEPRRWTVGELRAIGSFPPDYVLTGSYAEQYQRIGQSVPPVMMRQVALALLPAIATR
jgi:DNA (cytosine-5)-methyltransferase 1